MDPRLLAVSDQTAAVVALLRRARRPLVAYADLLEEAGSASALLEEEQGLLAAQLVAEAAVEVATWNEQGIQVTTLLEVDYPANLRSVYDRPPLLFVRGQLGASAARSIAVIGSRRASPTGLARAQAAVEKLVESGYTVMSGLAAGIDTMAHTAALDHGGLTVAVIGTGLHHAYPPQNFHLQERIAHTGAVISQFWPEAGPQRPNFPLRNAVMSGLSLATLVVEASHTSGARTQIRAALAHARPVFLADQLLDQEWARTAAARPGVQVVRSPAELIEKLTQLTTTDALIA